MKKPTGVIIAAVLLILLAILATLSTIGLAIVSAITPHPAANGRQTQIVEGFLVACFALPAIFTWCVALGLFRGKNWARIGGVVLGCLIALSNGLFALSTIAMMMMPQFHSQFANARFGLIMGVGFYLVLAAFGVWLVIYLSLRSVRQAFRPNIIYVPNTVAYSSSAFDSAGTTPLPTPPPAYVAVPSSATPEAGQGIALPRIVVLIFATLSILGSLSLLGMAAAGMPLFYLGVNLQGHAAALALAVLAAINIVIAIGLFRRFPPAYYAALAMQLLGIASSLALLSPSFRARTIQASMALATRVTPVQSAQMQSMMHSIQNGALLLNAILLPVILAFFIWAILRDLASIRKNAATR